MDPHHHDELEQNDLAYFLTHFGEWWEQHGNKVAITLVIVAAAFVGYRFYNMRTQTAHEERWTDLARAQGPDDYIVIGTRHSDDPAVSALASLRAADLLLAEATRGIRADPLDALAMEEGLPADQAQRLTPEEREELLDRAQRTYEAVLNNQRAHPVYRINARLGLAAITESRGQIEEARTLYQEILDQGEYVTSAIRAQVQARLKVLDRLAEPVHFATTPPANGEEAEPAPMPDEAAPGGFDLNGPTPEAPPLDGSEEQTLPPDEAMPMPEGPGPLEDERTAPGSPAPDFPEDETEAPADAEAPAPPGAP